jgi:hypothetical protein
MLGQGADEIYPKEAYAPSVVVNSQVRQERSLTGLSLIANIEYNI